MQEPLEDPKKGGDCEYVEARKKIEWGVEHYYYQTPYHWQKKQQLELDYQLQQNQPKK